MIDLIKRFFNKSNSLGRVVLDLHLPKVGFGELHWKWKKVNRDFCIDFAKEMNPHIAIVGQSGTGKSNACKLLLKEMKKQDLGFLLFDSHNEYVDGADDFGASVFNAQYNGINLFELDGLSMKEKMADITDNFKRIFRLGNVQAYTLYKCIAYTYKIQSAKNQVPNLHDLLFCITVFKRHANRQEEAILSSLESRLRLIDPGPFTKSVGVKDLIGQRSVFALSALHTNEAQILYIEGFLRKIYTNMLNRKKEDRPSFYIVVDEAEKLEGSTVLSRIVEEGRKYGIGVLAIAQRAKALDKSVRSNSSTMFLFYQREPDELNYMANLVAQGNEKNRFIEVKKAMRRLGNGQALLLRSAKEPSILRFKLYIKEKTHLKSRIVELARCAASEEELIKEISKKEISENRVRQELKILLEEKSMKSYYFDEEPYKGIWYIADSKNSAEHDVMVHLISRHLNKLGVSNKIYNNSFGPDVIAYKDGKRIAIEYETGKKRWSDTLRMLNKRKENYDEVVVLGKEKL